MAQPTAEADAAGATDVSVAILQAARQLGKFKERSLRTSRDDHIPMINQASRTPRVMLLGDSLLERMTTTGQSPSLHPWPSEQMLSKTQLGRLNSGRAFATQNILHRTSAVFNAGCGGDKIENVLYRLLGEAAPTETESPLEERQNQVFHGLVDSFSKRRTQVKLWVVHVGTNNLHKKYGLTDASLAAMRVLLRTLFHISVPETRVLVTALFYRKDIRNELIDQANVKFRDLVEALALEMSCAPAIAQISEQRCDSEISEALSEYGQSQHDRSYQADGVDEGADEQSSDLFPAMPMFKATDYRVVKARDDAEISTLEASNSRHDFQPKSEGPPQELDHFDMLRKRNKHLHLQIPHCPEEPRVQFLGAPKGFSPEQHLEDHVHLNLGGYQMWMETLFPVAADMLCRTDDMLYGIEQIDDRKRSGEYTKLSKSGSEL